jgi:ketosteroid isomerase-like protein
MSQENVERLRRSYEAFNATQEVDLDLWATDIVYVQTADVGAGETVYRGREGVGQAIGELTDAFDGFRVDPEEFFDLGDRVLAFVRLRGRAKRSGVPIDESFAHLATFRGSEIAHWQAYAQREEALEARGAAGVASADSGCHRMRPALCLPPPGPTTPTAAADWDQLVERLVWAHRSG